MSFEDLMRNRSAGEYADFVLPSIGSGDRVLDVGCGPGSITIGLAQVAGRELRGLLLRAGFERVEARTTYFSYGTEERVRTFGRGRASDCRDEWYVIGLTEHAFADQGEIDALEQAWTTWAESPDSFAAFAWGRATGRNP